MGVIMELTRIQKRYVNNKKLGFTVIKGGNCVGKTTSLVLRTINLENNYCIYESDKILFLSNNCDELNFAKNIYGEFNNKNQFYSLFSLNKDRVEFKTIGQLIDDYSNFYQSKEDLNLTYLNKTEILSKLESCDFKESINKRFNRSKLINNMSLAEIYDEILWIKACGFTEEEYILVERKGRKRRINRKSKNRQYIYSLVEIYNEIIRANGYMDSYDKTIFAINYSKSCGNKFSHLVVDDIQFLTKAQINFINSLYDNGICSSINFAFNSETVDVKDGCFIKSKIIKSIVNESKGKNFLFKQSFKYTPSKGNDCMEKYQFINFKHKNISEFNIDISVSNKEIYLAEGTTFVKDELLDIPVFNDIAAGNPIEIYDNIEDNFYLPEAWVGKNSDVFILHVKGDSMIEKNINDGDLIVIKKQQTAYHNDIVAASVDGEATLKILNTKGDFPVLAPANEMYKSISLVDKEVSIIGIALGVIKHR